MICYDSLLKCPFGSEAKFCPYQDTYAKDVVSAMQGELEFICKLDKQEDCPKMKELRIDTDLT